MEAFVKQSHERYVICEQFVDFANSKPFVRLVADLSETPPRWGCSLSYEFTFVSESFTLRILRDVFVIRFGIDTSLEVAKVESGVKTFA